jgi:hypothetical protein
MFEPQSVESHQVKHQPEDVGLNGKSTGNNEIASALSTLMGQSGNTLWRW